MTAIDKKVDRIKAIKEKLNDQTASIHLEPLLTTAELQALLKVDRRTIPRLVKRGELPVPLKLGGSNRWRPEEVKAAIDRLVPRAGRKLGPVSTPESKPAVEVENNR